MRLVRFKIGIFCLALTGCEATSNAVLEDVLVTISDAARSEIGQSGSEQTITRAELDRGLKQALEVSLQRTVEKIGVRDGYWGRPEIRIDLPSRLRGLQNDLRPLGLSSPLDDLQRRMNMAAEDAVPVAQSLILDAVGKLTIRDAVGLLRGDDDAITNFLRAQTEPELIIRFTPFVERTLDRSGAYLAMDRVAISQPFLARHIDDYKEDLTQHAVQAGMNGLFAFIASEEAKIRRDPVARTTQLLRKIFGSN